MPALQRNILPFTEVTWCHPSTRKGGITLDKLEATTNIVIALIQHGKLSVSKYSKGEDTQSLCDTFEMIYKTIGECEGSQVVIVNDLSDDQ